MINPQYATPCSNQMNFTSGVNLLPFVMSLQMEIIWLIVLAIPIACVAWTVTHEEVFREPREYCVKRSLNDTTLLKRKFFYLFTCEYCFSHYVTIFFIFLTDYKLLLDDWRGYLIAGFSLVWIANFYMNLFGLIRIDIKKDKTEIAAVEKSIEIAKEKAIELPQNGHN